jgi:ParB/RepB/Spo0J family partition protein
MHKHEEIPLDRLMRDPQQPRTLFVPGELTALSENIKKFGQRVPVIVFAQGDKFCLIDGERRARAKKLAGQPTVSAIVLPERPSEAELRMLQFSLDYHKASHTAMERSNHLARIMGETGCNVTELADKLDISQGMVSKLLAFQKLPEGLRAVLEKTPLDIEKVTQISKVKDPVRQIELVKSWGHLGREEFRDKVNDNGHFPSPERHEHRRERTGIDARAGDCRAVGCSQRASSRSVEGFANRNRAASHQRKGKGEIMKGFIDFLAWIAVAGFVGYVAAQISNYWWIIKWFV